METNQKPGWLWGVQVVTGDSQEEVLIFRDRQTHMHHNIYITIIMIGSTSIIITNYHQPGLSSTHIADQKSVRLQDVLLPLC